MVMVLRASAAASSTMGKWINKIPLASSMPDKKTISNIRAYMTFAVLLIGSRSMALGSGIQGGRAVSAVINSTSIQSVSSFAFRFERLER